MTFLNPLVLFGLAAAVIPLIIHLFNFRKPRRVDFSSLEFLKAMQRSTMRRVRIKQWILLALRTLAVVALVLAFARPTLQGPLAGAIGQRATSAVAIVLDNSMSMTLRDTRGEYLAQAKEMAAGIIDQMEAGDEVWLWPSAHTSETSPEPFTNRSTALDALRDVAPERGAQPLGRPLARAVRQLERALHLNKEVYVISDLQRTTFVDSVRFEAPEDVRLFLLPVGDREHGNVAVTRVQVLSRIVESGQPVRIEAELINFGTEPLEEYVVSVFLEGERVAQNTATLQPGGQATVPFTVTPQQRGWLAGLVETEDDAFGTDNVRHFTLHVPERRNVLIVHGRSQQTGYLELALSPELTQGRIAFDIQVVPEANLSAASLSDVDAVVLAGVGNLSSGDVAKLVGYVQEGGGLLLFPGEENAAAYNALLAGIGGGRVGGISGTPGSGRLIARFDRVDREHPLFEGVFEPETAARAVESPDIYVSASYTPGTGDEQTLIRLSNGEPFLQELRHDAGIVLLGTVAPDLRWSDLPMRGFFIPLVYRSMFYLSAGEESGSEGLLVGAAGAFRVAGHAGTESLTLLAPDGEEFTPEQRTLFGGTLVQTPPSLRTPGIYDVRAGDRSVRRIAFNTDRRESDLSMLSPAEAQTQLERATDLPVRTIDARGETGDVEQAIVQERYGVELWNIFILLALVFLVTEMLVAMQWRPDPVTA